MKRRTLLRTVIAVSAAGASGGAAATKGKPPVQLHTDLMVKAENEQKLLDDFQKRFIPNVKKAPGFIDAKLVKFVKANIGSAPERYNYRLIQTFQSEELREKWTHMEEHKIGWHQAIEQYVTVPFIAYLYEIAAEYKTTP